MTAPPPAPPDPLPRWAWAAIVLGNIAVFTRLFWRDAPQTYVLLVDVAFCLLVAAVLIGVVVMLVQWMLGPKE